MYGYVPYVCSYTLLSFLNEITFSHWFMVNTKLVDFCMLSSIQQGGV